MRQLDSKKNHQQRAQPENSFLRFCAFGGFLLLSLLLSAYSLATERLFEATYTGKLGGFKVTTTRTLDKASDDTYLLRSVAKSGFASIKETSQFLSVNGDFMAAGYDYRRSVFGAKTKKKIKFDWKNKKAVYSRDNKASSNREHDIELGILDPSLYQLKLQKDLANQKKVLKYSYVRSSRIVTMEFGFHQQTSISLNKKEYPAVEYKRIDDKDKQTFVTVIPELAYQIAKISVTDKDDKTYSTTIKEFSYDSQAMESFYAD